ncbi:hypothetical protein LTR97_002539 [Elasticomyces elasticus]|uniref:Uncharacterized protein n=1 Tax=Elasticomyces elasticus TaxID=574655 RepID=A0AAN7VWB5_9PEZI|nr:hypothetical protein LTR97_002539 [Elasticomyces elasticus]
MPAQPDKNFESTTTLLRALGIILLLFGAVTLFDVRYLLTATCPLIVAGAFIVLVTYTGSYRQVMSADMDKHDKKKAQPKLHGQKSEGQMARKERRKLEREALTQ